MALNRRSGQRFEANIWPGFVDAMTALLLVLVFVLSMFMIVQFMLRETISVQDSELDTLSIEVSALVDALGLERDRTQTLASEATDLNDQIDEQTDQANRQAALIASLQAETQDQAGRIGSFEEQVAGLLANQNDLRNQIVVLGNDKAALETNVTELSDVNDEATQAINGLAARISDIEAGLVREISAKEAAQLALAQARDEIDVSEEQARLAAARREALEALVADLKSQGSEKDAELAQNEIQMSQAELNRIADAAAAAALQDRLKNAGAELTAMSLTLEAKRKEAERTLTLLAAASAAEEKLNDRLIRILADTNAARDTAAQTEENLAANLKSEQAARQEAEAQVTFLLEQLKKAQGDEATIAGLRVELEARAQETAVIQQAQNEADAKARELLEQLRQIQVNTDVQATSLRDELAAALAAQAKARDSAGQALSSAQQQELLLSTANEALAEQKQVSTKGARQIEALNLQIAQLRSQLGGLQELLDASGARDVEANVQIQALGSKLNVALAQVASEQKRVAEEQRLVAQVQERRAELEEAMRIRLEEEAKELKSYRSEFFGQLRDLLGGQDGIRIEGDRFVFSSEVLFTPGSADLSVAGQGEIAKVASILRQISDNIPDTLNWVIRVDGHTDNVPLSGFGEFSDNWELSQARALSVVRLMSEMFDILPSRLSANGFGEYQPVASEDTPEGRAQNRRIELKLTEK